MSDIVTGMTTATVDPAADVAVEYRRKLRGAVLSPFILGYAIGPAALITLLLLGHYHLIVERPAWEWIVVFIAIPSFNGLVDYLYRERPSFATLNVRIAFQATTAAVVIYMTGWGPVLTGAFAFIALENMAHDGSKVWRVSALWSVVAVAGGQIAIAEGWAPSYLTTSQGEALAIMGVFVLLFVIRMASLTMERKEQAEYDVGLREERFRSLIQNSSDTTIVTDLSGHVTYVSPAAEVLFATGPDDLIGHHAVDLAHPGDQEWIALHFAALEPGEAGGEPVQCRIARPDGSWRYVEAVVTNQTTNPSVGGYVCNMRDITERKEAEALLEHQALHDALTSLPNRQLIMDRAEQMLVRGRRERRPVAAYFIDLDNFKDANDTLGHDAGDKLLQAVAARFTGILRTSDTVGRLGGDEFVVLAEGASLTAGPELVAERLQAVLREPFVLDGHEESPLTITASIGIAFGDRPTAPDLLRDADVALYRAKAAGKHCFTLFDEKMQVELLDRVSLKLDIHAALDRGEFFLLFQPVFDLDQVQTCGVEALLRWRHPARGIISPEIFVPILEESGEIVEVGAWVIDEACRQAAAWQERGHILSMSVNVSMRQLEHDGLVEHVAQALEATGLPARSLVIEITESTLMRDAEATIGRLKALKGLGVRIAIDDFGTGYSSLAYLQRFPVDALKIDRSFVAAMDQSTESGALIHTLVELGRTLGLQTLAEGIEEEAQLDGLREECCELGQGFLYSHPVPADAIEDLVTGSRPAGIPAPAPVRDATATG